MWPVRYITFRLSFKVECGAAANVRAQELQKADSSSGRNEPRLTAGRVGTRPEPRLQQTTIPNGKNEQKNADGLGSQAETSPSSQVPFHTSARQGDP